MWLHRIKSHAHKLFKDFIIRAFSLNLTKGLASAKTSPAEL